ncbi:MAG: hypothetical protein IKW33_00835 [Clostridia bacterium]|nr:hypothetical protein [Clostridia bacterium]MBR5191939.1 hypothetical protein [Clostridia bacterium]
MTTKNKSIEWVEIFNLYNTIKSLYALCEETDPELKTNLQPLNEFRAALDHLMRIVGIENLPEYKDKDIIEEARKLKSHLARALFDICDMLSINYRNKICDILDPFDIDVIKEALPTYYSKIKPRLEEITEEIADLRTNKRFEKEEDSIEAHYKIIKELKEFYVVIKKAHPSLIELNKKRKKSKCKENIIPIVAIAVAVVLAVIGWIL